MADKWETGETATGFIYLFFCSKITVDGDYSHKIKRHLLGKKAMTDIDSVQKAVPSLCQQRSIELKLWFFQ